MQIFYMFNLLTKLFFSSNYGNFSSEDVLEVMFLEKIKTSDKLHLLQKTTDVHLWQPFMQKKHLREQFAC